METLQLKIESELLKLKKENMLSIGKKIIPEVAKRIYGIVSSPNITVKTIDNPTIPFQVQPSPFYYDLLEKIKERFGATPAWRIPEDEYFKLVEECRGK